MVRTGHKAAIACLTHDVLLSDSGGSVNCSSQALKQRTNTTDTVILMHCQRGHSMLDQLRLCLYSRFGCQGTWSGELSISGLQVSIQLQSLFKEAKLVSLKLVVMNVRESVFQGVFESIDGLQDVVDVFASVMSIESLGSFCSLFHLDRDGRGRSECWTVARDNGIGSLEWGRMDKAEA